MPEVHIFSANEQKSFENEAHPISYFIPKWETQSDWKWTNSAEPFSPISAQSRMFYPRSYTASTSLNSLNTPWFIDYGHLTFWFFFLSTFVLIMWLVTLHGLTARNVESRAPRRETRGFSRAQSGDVMTAVLPMTWSITMLLHASTHSINFDENTAATTFSFTVIAYQWGWNYYFPKDIVEKLAGGPKLVGHNNIDMSEDEFNYTNLLAKSRSEYFARLTARGEYADRYGKDTAQSLLNLFIRPGGAVKSNLEMDLVSQMWAEGSEMNDLVKSLLKMQFSLFLYKTFANLQNWENSTEFYQSSKSWMSSGVGEKRLLDTLSGDAYRSLKFLRFSVNKNFNLKDIHTWSAQNQPCAVDLSEFSFPEFETEPDYILNNSTRGEHTLALIGNRLSLIHKHLTSSKVLSNHVNSKALVSSKLRHFVNLQSGRGALSNSIPFYFKNTVPSAPVRMQNIIPNLWFDFVFQNSQNNWHVEIAKNLNTLENISNKVNKITTKLNKLETNNLFKFSKPKGFIENINLQSNLYTGQPHSLGFSGFSLSGFDDFGLTNSASLKQLQLRTTAYSARATALNLSFFSNKKPSIILKQKLNNKVILNWASVDSRILMSHAKETNYSNLPTVDFSIPKSLDLPFNLVPLYLAAQQTPEISSGLQQWYLASLPLGQSLIGILSYKQWAAILPSFGLVNNEGLNAKLSSNTFFSKLFPAMQSGALLQQTKNLILLHSSKNTYVNVENTTNIIFQKLNLTKTPHKISNLLFIYKSLNLKNINLDNITFNFEKVKPNLAYYFKTSNLTAKVNKTYTDHFISLNTSQSLNLKPQTIPLLNFIFDLNLPYIKGEHIIFNSKLLISQPNLKNKIFYSTWLDGVPSQKPVRSGLDKTNDPINFNGKSEIQSSHPFFINQALFNWYWSWAGSTTNFALPLAKLSRGGNVKRFASGYWSSNWANDSLSKAALSPEQVIDLGKQSWPILTGNLSFLKRKTNFNELAPAVLDSEWSFLSKVPALVLPGPYEDLDQSFIHQKWGVEINTTRRSDHNSKYKVMWGPFVSGKLIKNVELSAESALNSVGPVTTQSNPTKTFQEIALLNETLLPFKTNIGLIPVESQSKLGDFFINNKFDATLTQKQVLTSSFSVSAAQTVKFLRLNVYSNVNEFLKNSPITPQTTWLNLWRFKTISDDLSNLTTKTNTKTHSSYWVARALTTTSLRSELLKHTTHIGAKHVTNAFETVGAQHPLIRDLQSLFSLDSESPATSGLMFPTWQQWKYWKLPVTPWAKIYESNYVKIADRLTESHLLARAGFNLVNDEIGSIRRLRVTKGVYLPSDTPMHIVCGSKDVIHSWALPGLNVKIDCIPGFNSHRRLMLRWRGVYWGQCMEVCGRYHHWMPILVHVVHKDIFLGWCLSYLKLIDAKSQTKERAIATLASVDLMSLESTFSSIEQMLELQPNWDVSKLISVLLYDLNS